MSKIAYLTIDDAPSRDMLPKLEYLIQRGVPAVWFCQGNFMEERPEPVIEAIRRGHPVGNHAYDHPRFSNISLEEGIAQIQRTDAILHEIYQQAGVPWTKKYFRFPYGDKGGLRGSDVFSPYEGEGLTRKDKLQQTLHDLGYTQPAFPGVTYEYFDRAGLRQDIDWNWTYDCIEWSVFQPEPFAGIDSLEKVLERMDRDNLADRCGLHYPDSEEIVLTHDHAETTNIFIPIVERLIAKGLDFRLPE